MKRNKKEEKKEEEMKKEKNEDLSLSINAFKLM